MYTNEQYHSLSRLIREGGSVVPQPPAATVDPTRANDAFVFDRVGTLMAVTPDGDVVRMVREAAPASHVEADQRQSKAAPCEDCRTPNFCRMRSSCRVAKQRRAQ